MRQSCYSEEKIIRVLQEVESGRTVNEVRRDHGDRHVPQLEGETRGMDVNEARRLKELEKENSRLKAAVAELTLRGQALDDALDALGGLGAFPAFGVWGCGMATEGIFGSCYARTET